MWVTQSRNRAGGEVPQEIQTRNEMDKGKAVLIQTAGQKGTVNVKHLRI